MHIYDSAIANKQTAFDQLTEAKTWFASKGWFPATSGNLSIRIGNMEDGRFAFAVTASGKDKSVNTDEDYLVVDENSRPLEQTSLKPSAETLIHREIYRLTGCGAVYHVHTVFNNLASELFWEQRFIPVDGVELIKAFNIWEEEAVIRIPILPNYAEIPRIVAQIADNIVSGIPGFVLHKHGVCAWGGNAFEAKRHLEAFEFLFEYVCRKQQSGI